MNLDTVSGIMNNAMMVTVIASLPCVGLGLLAGLIVSVFQAVTQIQEQTLSFAPKMIVVLLVFAMTFSWMTNLILDLTYDLWNNIPTYSRPASN